MIARIVKSQRGIISGLGVCCFMFPECFQSKQLLQVEVCGWKTSSFDGFLMLGNLAASVVSLFPCPARCLCCCRQLAHLPAHWPAHTRVCTPASYLILSSGNRKLFKIWQAMLLWGEGSPFPPQIMWPTWKQANQLTSSSLAGKIAIGFGVQVKPSGETA